MAHTNFRLKKTRPTLRTIDFAQIIAETEEFKEQVEAGKKKVGADYRNTKVESEKYYLAVELTAITRMPIRTLTWAMQCRRLTYSQTAKSAPRRIKGSDFFTWIESITKRGG